MRLDTHIAGVDDALISPLHFSGSASTASYVTERRNNTFAPQSGGLFSPTGIRLLRFNLADQQGFLDGQTIRLAFEIKNTGAGNLTPVVSSPACLFRRLRVIANGSAERRMNDVTETWGGVRPDQARRRDAVEPVFEPGQDDSAQYGASCR